MMSSSFSRLSLTGLDEDEGVNIYFVLPQGKNESTCSEDLSYAHEQALDSGLNPRWIPHDDVLELNWTKVDVFVMDPFDGGAFDSVCGSKATIVGPRCLLTCLEKKEPIPELPYPMFTAAMKGLILTSTGFEKEEKSRIQRLVERMAGIYSNAFHDGVTHLVAAVVRSSKYSVAVSKKIPIMTEEWVHQVWNKSQNDNLISASDPAFSRYACPALMGLSISVSHMSTKDKDLLKKSIESHGGSYSKILDMHSTNVLVISSPEGDKYTYAKKWKIPILNSNWIFDSIEKGYCLETENYKVEKRSCSTPTKEDVSKLTEVSLCSTIMGPDETATVKVDETVESSAGNTTNRGEIWLQTLDLSTVTKAGAFLEGLCVFLFGFDDVQQEHLRRVLQLGGATRLSQLSPSVTHVLLKSGEKPPRGLHDPPPHMVTVQWVVESMHLGRPAPESDFGPTQRSLMSLPPLFPKEDETRLEQNDEDSTRFEQNGSSDEDESTCTKFLEGKRLALVGLNEEIEQELTEWTYEEGGEIVSGDFKGTLDYLVLPVHGCDLHGFKSLNKVNHLWLSACFSAGDFVEMEEYYFKPYEIDLELKPLSGVVLGVSGFSSHERDFLSSITHALGGICQEVFYKADKGDKKKSTHLVSLAPEGNKYEAALKWKIPVVSKDWILSCVSKMTWVCEKPFLMGDSDTFSDNKPLPEDVGRELSLLEEDVEVHFKKDDIHLLTPVRPCRPLDSVLETPSLDIEKIRPIKIELSPSLSVKWNPPPDSQPSPFKSSSSKKCSQCPQEVSDDGFHCSKFDTPQEPYGAFLGAEKAQSSHARKYWKYHFDQMNLPSESQRLDVLEEIGELKSIHNTEDQQRRNGGESLKMMSEVLKDLNSRLRLSRVNNSSNNNLSEDSFEAAMEEKLNRVGRSWVHVGKRVKLLRDGSPPDDRTIYKLPFEGLKVYVTKKCLSLMDRISESVDRLGGSIDRVYDGENTSHVVFSSNKLNDITKEFRLGRADGKVIVCPDWIFECESERRLLDPSMYPHTRNAKSNNNNTTLQMNETLNSTTFQSSASKKSKKPRELDLPEESFNKPHPPKTAARANACSSLDSSPSKVSTDGGNVDTEPDDDESPIPQTQSCPLEEEDDEKEEQITNIDFQSMDVPENMTELMEEASSKRIRLMISGYPDEERASFSKFIDSLGDDSVSFSNLSGCDPDATHIITPKFSRSEKMLCAIASGKVFLHHSYMEDIMKAGVMLLPNMDKYEWGSPQSPFLSNLEEGGFDKQLALASYRWRVKISNKKGRGGAFEGIVAIVHSTPKRREAFQRLIEFGGGTVITPNPPYTDPGNATHCLAEPHRLPKTRIDYEALASRGIAVVEAIFIHEFLVRDPPPPVENYLIEEFKAFWDH